MSFTNRRVGGIIDIFPGVADADATSLASHTYNGQVESIVLPDPELTIVDEHRPSGVPLPVPTGFGRPICEVNFRTIDPAVARLLYAPGTVIVYRDQLYSGSISRQEISTEAPPAHYQLLGEIHAMRGRIIRARVADHSLGEFALLEVRMDCEQGRWAIQQAADGETYLVQNTFDVESGAYYRGGTMNVTDADIDLGVAPRMKMDIPGAVAILPGFDIRATPSA